MKSPVKLLLVILLAILACPAFAVEDKIVLAFHTKDKVIHSKVRKLLADFSVTMTQDLGMVSVLVPKKNLATAREILSKGLRGVKTSYKIY